MRTAVGDVTVNTNGHARGHFYAFDSGKKVGSMTRAEMTGKSIFPGPGHRSDSREIHKTFRGRQLPTRPRRRGSVSCIRKQIVTEILRHASSATRACLPASASRILAKRTSRRKWVHSILDAMLRSLFLSLSRRTLTTVVPLSRISSAKRIVALNNCARFIFEH